MCGTWGSCYNIHQAIFYLLKGDCNLYTRSLLHTIKPLASKNCELPSSASSPPNSTNNDYSLSHAHVHTYPYFYRCTLIYMYINVYIYMYTGVQYGGYSPLGGGGSLLLGQVTFQKHCMRSTKVAMTRPTAAQGSSARSPRKSLNTSKEEQSV